MINDHDRGSARVLQSSRLFGVELDQFSHTSREGHMRDEQAFRFFFMVANEKSFHTNDLTFARAEFLENC